MSAPHEQGALGPEKSFQERVVGNFRHVCNEVGDPTDLSERRDRFGEEAMEIFQSLDGSHEAARQIVDYVFGREKGQPRKEIGQGLVTLAALATHAGHDLMACGEEELARLWRPEVVAKIRSKRASRHGRGPLPGVGASAPASGAERMTAGEILAAACKPWEHYSGEPPDDGSPLSGVFVAGMVCTERLLAKLLDVAHYEGGDGSEDFDNDATQTLRNILAGANLWDKNENHPVTPAPATLPGVPDSVREAIQRLDEIRAEESKSFQNGGGLRLYRIIPQQSHAEALALEYVRTLLSAHPAGQSAGSGAEDDGIKDGRQWMLEAFAGFVNDPPDCDFHEGYLAALYVIAQEVFGMDPRPGVPPPPVPKKSAPHLRLVVSHSLSNGAAR